MLSALAAVIILLTSVTYPVHICLNCRLMTSVQFSALTLVAIFGIVDKSFCLSVFSRDQMAHLDNLESMAQLEKGYVFVQLFFKRLFKYIEWKSITIRAK